MTASVEIRDGVVADAEALAEFGARVFSDTYASSNTAEDLAAHLARTFSTEIQARELADPALRWLLAYADGELAGYAILTQGAVPAAVTGPKPCEVKRLYVDGRWQGRGIAAALMERAREGARAVGAQTLWLMAWEHNPRARAFYKKAGFEDVGSATFMLGGSPQVDRVFVQPL
jgi:ribosomal protein S18 acetylase RimI-like enzyme